MCFCKHNVTFITCWCHVDFMITLLSNTIHVSLLSCHHSPLFNRLPRSSLLLPPQNPLHHPMWCFSRWLRQVVVPLCRFDVSLSLVWNLLHIGHHVGLLGYVIAKASHVALSYLLSSFSSFLSFVIFLFPFLLHHPWSIPLLPPPHLWWQLNTGRDCAFIYFGNPILVYHCTDKYNDQMV